MLYIGSNKAVNDLIGLDADLLVDNFMERSIIPQSDFTTETSIFDDISISVQAGFYGMANNAIQIGNFLGGENDTYDIEDELGDLGQAYSESKDSYDLAGNIITSFIPGTIAFKALNAMKLGKSGGVIARSLGFFDQKSKRALEETAGIYRNSLDITKVKALKRKAFVYSTLDEVVSGAVIGAAVEVSQNLGGILVDESLTFGEKLGKFVHPIFLGAAIGAPFGGLNYAANARKLVAPAKEQRDGVLGDLAYEQLFTKGRSADISDLANASNHVLDQIDKIEGYVAVGAEDLKMVDLARTENIVLADTQFRGYVKQISTLGKAGGGVGQGAKEFSKEQKDVVKALNNMVDQTIGSKEGRDRLRNLMGSVVKADANPTHASQVIFNKTKAESHLDVGVFMETPSAKSVGIDGVLRGGSDIDFQGADFKLIPLTPALRAKGKTLANKDKPLSGMALNTDHPEVMNNLEKYQVLNRLVGITSVGVKGKNDIVAQINTANSFLKTNGIDVSPEAGIFDSLAKVKQLIDDKTSLPPKGKDKVKFILGMKELFKRMDDADATEFLLDSVSNKWVNVKDGSITPKPLASLYGKKIKDIKTPKSINALTGLLGVQKLRVQAGVKANGSELVKLDKEYFKTHLDSLENTPEGELKAWLNLDQLTSMSLALGESGVKLGDGSMLPYGETFARLRKAKSKAAVELLKNNSADDVLNTLGVSDMGVLMNKAIPPNNPSVEQMKQLVGDTSGLQELTHIRLTLKTKTLSPEEVLLRSGVESDRLRQIEQMRLVASESVGENLDDIFLKAPSLGNVEEIDQVGRFVIDSHLKGKLSSWNFFSIHINDQTTALAGRLKKKIESEHSLGQYHNALINSPKSAGEIVAYKHWYKQQGEKFNLFKNKEDGSVTMLDSVSAKKFEAYREEALNNIEKVDSVPVWLSKNPTLKTNSYTVKDKLAVDYITAIKNVNTDKVLKPKRLQEEAYGNTIIDDQGYVYMPPSDLPYSRYFRVKSENPFSQTSSTLYKVSSHTEAGISAEIAAARKEFAAKGIKADLISGSEAAERAALKLEANHDAIELSLGKAITTAKRSGANPDLVLDSIHDIIKDTNLWVERSVRNQANTAMELHYAPEISQLRSLRDIEEKYRFVGDDTLRGQDKKRTQRGTYQTIHDQMLGVAAPFSTYNKVNNWVADSMATALQGTHEARLLLMNHLSKYGEVTRKEIEAIDKIAKKELSKRGLESPIGNAIESYLVKESTLTGRDINEAVASLQYVASTLLLRLDGIDPIMNVLGMTVKLSSEMKYIQEVIKDSPKQKAQVEEVYSRWFGAGQFKSGEGLDLNLLSPYKAVAVGMKDMFGAGGEGKKFLAELEEFGIYKGDIKIMMELADDLVIPQGISDAASKARFLGKARDSVAKAAEWGTGVHKASINLTQYTALKFAADVADAAGVDLATKRALMSGMNHRVNAISSHASKPLLFQGLVGNAVSLYQSYFSHTIGNLVRHAGSVGSGPVIRNIAMNASFFGAQSTPAFDIINSQIAGIQDKNNADLYSTSYDILPEPVADALMYGVGSTILRANLSSRGDLTPRYLTVIPNTFQDLPVVSAVINTVGAVVENVYKAASGERTATQAVMNTIIDSKLNRPLSGLVSVLNGKTVDSRNSLVSTHDDLISWGNAVRLAGAKPMDEARVNQAFWNLQSYRTKDTERKANLANIMKAEFHADPSVMESPEWMQSKYNSYINAGGNQRNFKRFYEQNVLKASTTFEQRLQVSIKNVDVAKNYKNVLGID